MKAPLFQILHSTIDCTPKNHKTILGNFNRMVGSRFTRFKHVDGSIWILSVTLSFLDVGRGTELADWCYTMTTPITVSSLMMAKTMSHHDGHNYGPLYWPLQYSIKTAIAVSLLLAFDLQLAIIVIFTFAIMLAIYNHDIKQNLAEKSFFLWWCSWQQWWRHCYHWCGEHFDGSRRRKWQTFHHS